MEKMVYFYPKGHEAHYEVGHPERPERVEAICDALDRAGWWEAFPHLEALSLPLEFIAIVHSLAYLEHLKATCRYGARLDMDTYTTPASWDLALQAAGGSVAVASAVWEGRSQRGFALARPPGHHATHNQGMGFCLLNNIAIAAEFLISQPLGLAPKAQRLAIIDLDLHHGNGTQDIFWHRGDVLYISTHQSPLYPGTGRLEETGAGAGQMCNANFPLPPATGDAGFRAVMRECILPLLDRFAPQMLLVSAGFDPHWRDPLGHLMLSATGYGELIADLTAWADEHCQGKIAIFTEGGYDLECGAACAVATVATLLGEPYQDPIGPSPRPEGQSYQAVVREARRIWGL